MFLSKKLDEKISTRKNVISVWRKGGQEKSMVILLHFKKKTRSTPTIFLYMLFMLQTLYKNMNNSAIWTKESNLKIFLEQIFLRNWMKTNFNSFFGYKITTVLFYLFLNCNNLYNINIYFVSYKILHMLFISLKGFIKNKQVSYICIYVGWPISHAGRS